MSFLNANANQVFCKVAVHGEGAACVVEALASLPGMYAPDDPGFRAVELVVNGYAIGPYALRLCVYALNGSVDVCALDGGDAVHALLLGADAIAVIVTGTTADRAALAAIAPYATEGVPVVLACPLGPDPGQLGVPYPAIAIDPGEVEGARAVLRALVPEIVTNARAKWLKS